MRESGEGCGLDCGSEWPPTASTAWKRRPFAFLEALEGTTSPTPAFSSSQDLRSKPCPLTTVRDPKPARLSRQVLQISFQ
jgi:hypothetical protein